MEIHRQNLPAAVGFHPVQHHDPAGGRRLHSSPQPSPKALLPIHFQQSMLQQKADFRAKELMHTPGLSGRYLLQIQAILPANMVFFKPGSFCRIGHTSGIQFDIVPCLRQLSFTDSFPGDHPPASIGLLAQQIGFHQTVRQRAIPSQLKSLHGQNFFHYDHIYSSFL